MTSPLISLFERYTQALEDAEPLPLSSSPYRVVADQILEMAWAYQSDGRIFIQSDDPVNALAAWCYGYGWLDAGRYLGFISGSDLLFEISLLRGTIPTSEHHKLVEKRSRYQEMLFAALTSIESAPDESSPLSGASVEIRNQGILWLRKGEVEFFEGLSESALAAFSYGYGWLDLGVRAGLFRITGDRHLFTA